MAGISAALPAIQTATTVLGGVGSLYAGMQAKNAAYDEADQLMQRARARRAEANRAQMEELRLGRLARSRALAVGSATGGADDPSVLKAMENLDVDSRYRALTALYEGDSEALGLTLAATNRKKAGRAAAIGGGLSAARSVLSGVTTLRTQYP